MSDLPLDLFSTLIYSLLSSGAHKNFIWNLCWEGEGEICTITDFLERGSFDLKSTGVQPSVEFECRGTSGRFVCYCHLRANIILKNIQDLTSKLVCKMNIAYFT